MEFQKFCLFISLKEANPGLHKGTDPGPLFKGLPSKSSPQRVGFQQEGKGTQKSDHGKPEYEFL